jgi:hypothetical protein
MKKRDVAIGALATAVALVAAAPARSSVIVFLDRAEWEAAVGKLTTIDFTGFDEGTFITDQYADLGIIFSDGNDSIYASSAFVNDGWGLDGNGDIVLAFDQPQAWIGFDYPGFLEVELYSDGELFFESDSFGGGVGNFLGLLSTEPFDAAVLIDFIGEAAIDDLHFGVPAPGSICLLSLAAIHRTRRRCSQSNSRLR